MARLPPKSARVVGLALWSGAAVLGILALAFFLGLLPVADEIRGTIAGVLGAVAVLDLLMGFWFFRASLNT